LKLPFIHKTQKSGGGKGVERTAVKTAYKKIRMEKPRNTRGSNEEPDFPESPPIDPVNVGRVKRTKRSRASAQKKGGQGTKNVSDLPKYHQDLSEPPRCFRKKRKMGIPTIHRHRKPIRRGQQQYK